MNNGLPKIILVFLFSVLAIGLTTLTAYALLNQSSTFRYRTTEGKADLLWSFVGEGKLKGLQGATVVDDYEKDGSREILISAYGSSADSTYFSLLSGRTGAIINTYKIRHNRTVATSGDLNNDGKKEVVLIAALSRGNPSIVANQYYLVCAMNPQNGKILWKPSATEGEPGFGGSAFVIPDENGDGISDLVISSSYLNGHLPRIHFVSGKDGTTFGYFNALQGSSNFFGTAIAVEMLDRNLERELLVNDILFGPSPTRVEARV